MPSTQIQLLQQLNSTWNEDSDFKVNFLNTGSFFEISNSAHKAHDVSFQSILQALRDILSNPQAKHFINCSQRSPAPFNNNVQEARDLFDDCQGVAGVAQCTEWKYFEKLIRVLGERVFTHPRAKVAAQEQSKLFFNAISRVVHIANGLSPIDLDNRIPFTDTNIDSSINFLEIAIEDCTLTIPTTILAGTIDNNSNVEGQLNTIFLGAPGTGKSWAIEQQTLGSIKIRTVFHPETQYSDFVGSLRPKMEDFGSGRTVGYSFRPGPFTNAYIEAKKNPSQRVYLVIEEINRAPAASVFGDLFQLIEPDTTYEIDIDPDMLDYINGNISPQRIEKLTIPPNLTLLATMNSSDQGVNTLDTAFKRRWAIKYMPIDYSNATSGLLSIPILGTHILIEWRDFSKIINQKLMEIDVPEDRLLGHRFLSIGEIADISSSRDTLRYKLLVYLWDDVLRHGRRQSIFAAEVNGIPLTTFGQLVAAYSDGYSIFKEEVEELLAAAGQIQQVDN
ncbi:AAA family ATPase [Lelliottia amnigena]|uniref:AAA family ATPase n=1 Tax=Lelliottia amnigena TaxID=61646 RepID=A0AAP2ACK0_LELAM|nr:AAA family ATPase [Lelliottia amnigena]MBL5898861.1 AAA family ATPase [Lelliottia amnigena]MBL5934398.1 AAA family ATPase [Lelliottia amnigena]